MMKNKVLVDLQKIIQVMIASVTFTNCSYRSLMVFIFWFCTTLACWKSFCCWRNKFCENRN